MTIDEFIEHLIEVAEENRINANNIESNMYIPLSVDKDSLVDSCIKCAEEHEQLARWLEELKHYREVGNQLNELINGSPFLKDIFEIFTIKEQNK